MVTSTELRARVAESFDGLGMPSWANPHPDGAQPRDEEYSRVTEPSRYDIVHARARAWTEHLGQQPGVRVEPIAPGENFDRGTKITSTRAGTLPLLLLEQDAEHAVLRVAVAEPELEIALLPDCGCDACDWGCDDLLAAVDDKIAMVVGGPFVVLRGKDWHAQWHPGGGSAGGGVDLGAMMELCRRLAGGEDVDLPQGTEAFAGAGWFN
ncbi:hypothetical protein GCM10022247_03910 [Allokutzneria multivorans]|uniref:Uncharacterized protein n=1 Tax=Allokutzneria multivorans TaxID=1142134 RepID=A0ABP7QVU0_9PSEU